MCEKKKTKNEYMPPSFFSAEKGMMAGTQICRECNVGKRMATMEGHVPLLGKEKKSQPDIQMRMLICEHCGATKMKVLNRRELSSNYSM